MKSALAQVFDARLTESFEVRDNGAEIVLVIVVEKSGPPVGGTLQMRTGTASIIS